MRDGVEEGGAFAFVVDQDDVGTAESLFNRCLAGEVADQEPADGV